MIKIEIIFKIPKQMKSELGINKECLNAGNYVLYKKLNQKFVQSLKQWKYAPTIIKIEDFSQGKI